MFSSRGALLVDDTKGAWVLLAPAISSAADLQVILAMRRLHLDMHSGASDAAETFLGYRLAVDQYLCSSVRHRPLRHLGRVWLLLDCMLSSQGHPQLGAALAVWLRRACAPSMELLHRIETRQTTLAESSKEFWRLCATFVIHGRMEEAAQCVDLAIAENVCPPSASGISTLLRSKPERHALLKRWRSQCSHMLAGLSASLDEDLSVVLGVMAGQLDSLRAASRSWVELMIAHLVYVDSMSLTRFDLQRLAEKCLVWTGVVEPLSMPLDQRMIFALLCDQVGVALRLVVQESPVWFSYHLVDFAFSCGFMGSELAPLTEDLLLKYASEWLRSEPSLWRTALYYLDSAGGANRQVREAHARSLLDGLEPGDQQHSMEVIAALEQCSLDLQSVKYGLARYWTARCFHQGAMQEAAGWAQLCHSRYPELMESIRSNVSLTPPGQQQQQQSSAAFSEVAVLAEYRQLLAANNSGDLKTTASLVMGLLESGAPKGQWIELLSMCLSVLTNPVPLFNAEETQKLLVYTERLIIEDNLGSDRMLRRLQRALTKNLAVTMLL